MYPKVKTPEVRVHRDKHGNLARNKFLVDTGEEIIPAVLDDYFEGEGYKFRHVANKREIKVVLAWAEIPEREILATAEVADIYKE
jgi:hypothetical protein